MAGADGQQNVPHSEWLRIFERVLNEVKTEMKEQGREGDFVGAKVTFFFDELSAIYILSQVIYCTLRYHTPEELEWYTEDCIALKKEFPHLIAGMYLALTCLYPQLICAVSGFDLVGDENVLKPLIDYLEPLQKFRLRQQEEGVEIPFLFHAGETLGDGTMADNNLYDAILLGTKRIGHG
jgi:adenosine deaminase CECR1